MRGNPGQVAGPDIPSEVYPRACGGTPISLGRPRVIGSTRVYPRACGGTANITPKHSTIRRGLSPRVRGNLHAGKSRESIGRSRSIPARAGEPRPNRVAVDYDPGLSPRVRGNLARRQLPLGKWVYPRACGGTRYRLSRFAVAAKGLSPRVRGNPRSRIASAKERSIPARAGEPHPPIHPRRARTGSIPARAGEPLHACTKSVHVGVYPRACGGTLTGCRVGLIVGVYPRACGGTIIPTIRPLTCSSGSIPARAGEPRKRMRSLTL